MTGGTGRGVVAGFAAGLAAGLLLPHVSPLVFAPAHDLGLDAAPATPPAGVAAMDPGVGEAAERLGLVCERLEAMAARLEAPAHAPAVPAPPVTAVRGEGALVPWLPPEGVPLVQRWYTRELGRWIRAHEDMLAMPRNYLRGVEVEGELQDAMDGWRTRIVRWQADVDGLARVTTELELAKWLDATRYGTDHRPAAWQLAELAAESP